MIFGAFSESPREMTDEHFSEILAHLWALPAQSSVSLAALLRGSGVTWVEPPCRCVDGVDLLQHVPDEVQPEPKRDERGWIWQSEYRFHYRVECARCGKVRG